MHRILLIVAALFSTCAGAFAQEPLLRWGMDETGGGSLHLRQHDQRF